jgi:hypothetical protein
MSSHSDTESVRAVLRLRTQASSGTNDVQTEIIDRLETLSENGTITDLDIGVWGTSMGINVLSSDIVAETATALDQYVRTEV